MPELIFDDSKQVKIGLFSPQTNLQQLVTLYEEELEMFNSFKNDKRKREFLAARFILKNWFNCDEVIKYDANGKPYLQNKFISISHSGNFVGLSFSSNQTGLDIECITPKITRVKHKFLNEKELGFVGNNLTILHFCWTIKEAIYKYFGLPGVDFKDDIQIQPFHQNESEASVIFKDQEKFKVKLRLLDELAIAYI
jgi:phosphopantetheinyl transferase